MRPPWFEWTGSEPSLQTGFAGNRIDRRAEQRDDDAALRALQAADARIMLVHAARICLKSEGGRFSADFTLEEAKGLDAGMDQAVLLGHDGKVPVLMARVRCEELPAGVESMDFRTVYVSGSIPPDRLGAMAQGVSLFTWNETHLYCGRCGGQTRMRDGGYRRSCTQCAAEHFPRTDPVVIMLVTDGNFCLLGRSPRFQPGMYSCLAGFLEPGETIEAAVRRETFEESGIRVGAVRYHASQPWPFPHTLMIGCYGEALARELTIDRAELEDCRWFSREETLAMLRGEAGELSVPPPGAIAALLIRDWAQGA